MKFRVGNFEKNILTLMPGSVASQAIPIISFPLLTRLYTPGDFGTTSLFINITTIFAIFATLRLEVAFFYSRDKVESQKVFNTIVFWIFAFCILTSPFLFLLKNFLPDLLNNPNLSSLIFFLPISIAMMALYHTFLTWLNYCGDYKGLSFNRGLRTGMEVLLKISMSTYGFFGLVFGGLLGLLISLLHLYKRSNKFLSYSLFAPVNKKHVISKYSHLPMFQIPGHLTSVLNLALPVMFISHWTTKEFLGLFVVAYRVANIPMGFLGAAIGEVYRREASEEILEKGDFSQSYLRTLFKLVPISLIIFGLGYLLCPYVFPFFLGNKWGGVERLFQLLCPMFALQLIARPLSHSLDIGQRQRDNMIWQVMTLVVIGLTLYTSFFNSMDKELIVLRFSIAYSFCNLLNILLSFRSSYKPLRKSESKPH